MKLRTKITSLFAAMTMALGVGVAVSAVNGQMLESKAANLTDTLTVADTTATGTTYVSSTWTSSNGVAYSAQNGKSSGGGIQFRSKNSNSGLVTTNTIGYISSVVFTWDSETASGRTMDVYGATSTYADPTALYDTTKQGTKVGSAVYGTSTTVTFPENTYTYVGLKSNSGAQYITSIAITYITSGETIALTSLATPTLSAATVEAGSTITASTTYAPTNTTESLTWSITGTNTDAATISNIVFADGAASITVTGAKAGSCTITATPTVTASLAKTSSALVVTAPALTALTMNKSTAAITKGNTIQLSVTPTPELADASVTWTTSDPTVATVVNGLVTAGTTVGDAIITATSTTVSSITATCTVTVSEPKTYNLVTTIGQLVDGAVIVIGGYDGTSKYYAMEDYVSGNNFKAAEATVASNVLTAPASAAEVTVGVVDGGYTFKAPAGYLYAAGGTSNNYMKASANRQTDSTDIWTVTITDGAFSIVNVGNTTKGVMQLNSSNATNILFSCYATASMKAVQLYIVPPTPAETEATNYATSFLAATENCTTTVEGAWAAQKSAYQELSADAQTILKNANYAGILYEQATTIQKCVWRYDVAVIYHKNAETQATLENFMSRGIEPQPMQNTVTFDLPSNILIIVTVIGLISVGSICVILIANKKRKAQ